MASLGAAFNSPHPVRGTEDLTPALAEPKRPDRVALTDISEDL